VLLAVLHQPISLNLLPVCRAVSVCVCVPCAQREDSVAPKLACARVGMCCSCWASILYRESTFCKSCGGQSSTRYGARPCSELGNCVVAATRMLQIHSASHPRRCQVRVIGLYDPTTARNIDQALARLPPDLKKFASGLDYRPIQLLLDEAETTVQGPNGEESNEVTEEPTVSVEAEEVAAQQSSPNPLEVSVNSPAGSYESDQVQFTPVGEVATQTITWILRAAGLRAA
jgi:hypothetical protein